MTCAIYIKIMFGEFSVKLDYDTQLAECMELAKEFNCEVLKVYLDIEPIDPYEPVIQPALQQLLEDSKTQIYDFVFISGGEVFSKNDEVSMYVSEKLTENNVAVLAVRGSLYERETIEEWAKKSKKI